MFHKINKSGSGVVDLDELDTWVSQEHATVGTSVFLPMLFELVPVSSSKLQGSPQTHATSHHPSPSAFVCVGGIITRPCARGSSLLVSSHTPWTVCVS